MPSKAKNKKLPSESSPNRILMSENIKLQKQIKRMKETKERSAIFQRQIADILEPIKSKLVPPQKHSLRSGDKGQNMSAVLLLSDWHIGEVVSRNQVGDINEFNWDIAQKRVYWLTRKFIKWISKSQNSKNIDEAVLVCIGDFNSGDIQEDNKYTNEFPSPQQSVYSGLLLAKCVAEIAQSVSKVRVEFVALDNHGRLSKKNQWKDGSINNYNWITGFIAKERLRGNKNISFKIHEDVESMISIKGHNYLCIHGHQIPCGGPFPYYSINKFIAKECKGRRLNPKVSFKKVLLAHYHEPIHTSDFTVNGCLVGASEYGVTGSYNTDPVQCAFLVHPEYADTEYTNFYLREADSQNFNGQEQVVLDQDL